MHLASNWSNQSRPWREFLRNDPVIPLVQDGEGPEEVQQLFERIRSAIGFVPNLFRLWANAAHLLPVLVKMETTICGEGKVRRG